MVRNYLTLPAMVPRHARLLWVPLCLFACNRAPEPTGTGAPTSAPLASASTAPTAPPPAAPSGSSEAPTGSLHGRDDEFFRARPPNDNPSQVSVSQILIAYRGAEGAPKQVQRSKDEAKNLADHIAVQARVGVPWNELVSKFSDDPVSAKVHGELGKITRAEAGKALPDAALHLFAQETSEPVETPAGFHILKRTE